MSRVRSSATLLCVGAAMCLIAASPVLSADTAKTAEQPSRIDASKIYNLRNKEFGNLLRPRDASNRDLTPLVLYPAQPWKCLAWRFAAAQDGSYRLQNLFTSKTFAGKSGTPTDQCPLVQVPYDQDNADKTQPQWQFFKLADDCHRIVDPASHRVLTAVRDEKSGEVRVMLAPWADQASQQWELSPIAPESLTM